MVLEVVYDLSPAKAEVPARGVGLMVASTCLPRPISTTKVEADTVATYSEESDVGVQLALLPCRGDSVRGGNDCKPAIGRQVQDDRAQDEQRILLVPKVDGQLGIESYRGMWAKDPSSKKYSIASEELQAQELSPISITRKDLLEAHVDWYRVLQLCRKMMPEWRKNVFDWLWGQTQSKENRGKTRLELSEFLQSSSKEWARHELSVGDEAEFNPKRVKKDEDGGFGGFKDTLAKAAEIMAAGMTRDEVDNMLDMCELVENDPSILTKEVEIRKEDIRAAGVGGVVTLFTLSGSVTVWVGKVPKSQHRDIGVGFRVTREPSHVVKEQDKYFLVEDAHTAANYLQRRSVLHQAMIDHKDDYQPKEAKGESGGWRKRGRVSWGEYQIFEDEFKGLRAEILKNYEAVVAYTDKFRSELTAVNNSVKREARGGGGTKEESKKGGKESKKGGKDKGSKNGQTDNSPLAEFAQGYQELTKIRPDAPKSLLWQKLQKKFNANDVLLI